jgi:hypothetical protein
VIHSDISVALSRATAFSKPCSAPRRIIIGVPYLLALRLLSFEQGTSASYCGNTFKEPFNDFLIPECKAGVQSPTRGNLAGA